MTTYLDWTITYNPKPIANFSFDWDAVHNDYDGETLDDNGNELAFELRSLEDCKDYIDEITEHKCFNCDTPGYAESMTSHWNDNDEEWIWVCQRCEELEARLSTELREMYRDQI